MKTQPRRRMVVSLSKSNQDAIPNDTKEMSSVLTAMGLTNDATELPDPEPQTERLDALQRNTVLTRVVTTPTQETHRRSRSRSNNNSRSRSRSRSSSSSSSFCTTDDDSAFSVEYCKQTTKKRARDVVFSSQFQEFCTEFRKSLEQSYGHSVQKSALVPHPLPPPDNNKHLPISGRQQRRLVIVRRNKHTTIPSTRLFIPSPSTLQPLLCFLQPDGFHTFDYQDAFFRAVIHMARPGLLSHKHVTCLVQVLAKLRDEDALYRVLRGWMHKQKSNCNNVVLVLRKWEDNDTGINASIRKLVRLGAQRVDKWPCASFRTSQFQWPPEPRVAQKTSPVSLLANSMPLTQRELSQQRRRMAKVTNLCIHVLLIDKNEDRSQNDLVLFLRTFGEEGFYFYDMNFPFEEGARSILEHEEDVTQESFLQFANDLEAAAEQECKDHIGQQPSLAMARFWHWYEHMRDKCRSHVPVVIYNAICRNIPILLSLQQAGAYLTAFEPHCSRFASFDYSFVNTSQLRKFIRTTMC